MTARGLYWRCVKARASDAENSGGAWRRVEARGRSDEDENSQKGRSERVRSDDVICGLIGEAEAMVEARQWSLMY